MNELSHCGTDDDLAVFAVFLESALEGRDYEGKPHGDHGRHIEAWWAPPSISKRFIIPECTIFT